MAEAVGGHRELERHRRPVPVLVTRHLEEPASVGEHVGDDGRVDDTRQKVGVQHPLVVLDHLLTRTPEAIRRRNARVEGVDDAVVESDHRGVQLRDGEVLVVSLVRDDRGNRFRRR